MFTSPAPINWCESDYAMTGWIAEFHNTITNSSYVIAALILLFGANRRFPSNNSKFLFYFYCLSLLLTGFTSGYFHATLMWGAQKLDETFETWTVLTLLHCSSREDINKIIKYVIIHCVFATLCLWYFEAVFCELHLILISVLTVNRLYWSDHLSATQRKQLVYAGSFALLGFACWLLDFFGCVYTSMFYLHAYGWHIFTGIALYISGLLLEGLLHPSKQLHVS
jgi:dihydroceramidase